VTVLNALTVDVEDWRQLVRRVITGENLPPGRDVVDDTEAILREAEAAGVRGTFFVLDNVAAAWPGLVRRIAAAGHEVGSHGLSHRRIYDLSPAEFRAETRAAKARLEDLLGTPVQGYRAAEFSITRASWWALEILAEEGFTYDSSVYPFAGSRYGVPDFPLAPTVVETPAGPIREAPMTVLERRGRRYPAVGGGWLRFFPYAWHRAALAQNNAAGRPGVLYLHPYELARRPVGLEGVRVPPRRRMALLRYSWVHNRFRPQVLNRFRRLVGEFPFAPMLDVLSRFESVQDGEQRQHVLA
jgi:polysaccharide deacetylase family protein (PEP-CTERM system associated)